MADMFLNLDMSGGPSNRQAEHRNHKHQRFIKKRKFLEKRGYLKQKQLPLQGPNNPIGHQSKSWDHGKQNGQPGAYRNLGQRPEKSNSNIFHSHQQEEPFTSSRIVTAGTSSQSGMLNVRVDTSSIHSNNKMFTSKDTASKLGHFTQLGSAKPDASGAKDSFKPSLQQQNVNLLSEFESGIPSATPALSYKTVAIDCEMVGTGLKGSISALARCSIVSYHGDVVYDNYIRPANPITDYRTKWSGIRREHLINAIPFVTAQKEILKILRGKIVIGHAIHNDYKALGYFHPKEMTRDTSKIPSLNRKAGFPEKEIVSLKRLAKQLLHKDIQTGRGGHSSVEDAKTTMELYRIVEAEHEKELALGQAS
ncbi:interferon-stimulated 20 kDa exonuclease-like 2 [Hyperolius riggenbachi]|uniref:interferon-stimulated 20 kDa exonuclease-like 2 n=1 Tax=Hyperolius riggenbachi TaxID=752182 RepID=UPI0035A2E60A